MPICHDSSTFSVPYMHLASLLVTDYLLCFCTVCWLQEWHPASKRSVLIVTYYSPFEDMASVDITPDKAEITSRGMHSVRFSVSQCMSMFWSVELCTRLPRQLTSCFDFLVSNPPYVTSEEMQFLEPEIVRYQYRSFLAWWICMSMPIRFV